MVTGAGRGIGKAMAMALAGAGAKVALLEIDADVLAAAGKDVESSAGKDATLTLRCDVTSTEDAQSALDTVLKRFGRLDALINDAVVGPERINDDFLNSPAKFWELEDSLFRLMLKVNVFGPQLMARTVAPTMIAAGRGRIINITTSLDTMYKPGVGGYGPSKAALEAHTRIMAQDLEGTGVSANILIPGGPANTRMIPAVSGIDRTSLIQPEIMGEPIVWLCSDDAQGVNGLRFLAVRWDSNLARDARIEQASDPIAWPQLGSQAVNPESFEIVGKG